VVEKKVNENDLDDNKDGEVEIKEGNCQGKKKMFWPAISYWIALQSLDGVRVSTIPVHLALLETDMEVTEVATRLHKRKGRECRHWALYAQQ